MELPRRIRARRFHGGDYGFQQRRAADLPGARSDGVLELYLRRDHGTQFASADVKAPNQGAVHMADQQQAQGQQRQRLLRQIHNQGIGGCFPQPARRRHVMKMTIITDVQATCWAPSGPLADGEKGWIEATCRSRPATPPT
jgi:hypothetical protein